MSARLVESHPSMASMLQRLAPFRQTLGTTGGLVLATAINSATGFVFWWIAARVYPEAAVGLAGAAVSAMLLLSQISVLGLGTTLAGMIHRERRVVSLAVTALLAAGGAGVITGTLFALLVPALSDEFAPVASSPLVFALFAGGVSLTALSAVLDQVFVAILRGSYQLLRNVVFSFSRLALLVVAAAVVAPSGMVIYGAWVAGTILSLIVIAVLPRGLGRMGDIRPLQWEQLGGMAFGALSHHILNLSRSSSVWLLPLLVTVVLSREANASFYVALLLANFIALIGTSATFTLYVVGARSPEQLWRQMRLTLALSMFAAVGGTIVMWAGGGLVLSAFGSTYAEAAYPTVAILALSTLPLAVKDHWIALQRLRGGVGRAATIGVATLALELFASFAGAVVAGMVGLAILRFAVLLAQGLAMAPSVIRALRRPDGSPPMQLSGLQGVSP